MYEGNNESLKAFKSTTVSSWDELINLMHSEQFTPKKSSEGNHYRSPYIFRGMDNADWNMQTSLERLDHKNDDTYLLIENSLIRSFRKFAKDGLFDKQSEWYVLAVAQHNGLPTRCLDWSWSPMVAAHFACGKEEHKNDDGVVWCLDATQLRKIFEEISEPKKSIKGKSWVYDTKSLEENYEKLENITEKNGEDFMILWEPPSLDARIANQGGLLSVSNQIKKTQDQILINYIEDYPDLVHRIIIKAEAKGQVRDMLDMNNISERTLFPGLPGLCNWLKRYYNKAWEFDTKEHTKYGTTE